MLLVLPKGGLASTSSKVRAGLVSSASARSISGSPVLSPVMSTILCSTRFIRHRRRVPGTISLPKKVLLFKNAAWRLFSVWPVRVSQ